MTTRLPALLAALAMAAGGLFITAPAAAGVDVHVGIQVATRPPPPRYELTPAPRRGYVWSPGYWNWTGVRYVWTPGTWYPVRTGYDWYAPAWVQMGGSWRFREGYWRARGHAYPPQRMGHDRGYRNGYRDGYRRGRHHGR